MNNSLFYIRFLKPPPLKCTLYQPFNVVWVIESDLGDRPFGGEVKLRCETNDPDITIKFLPLDNKKAKKGNTKDDASLPLTNFDYNRYRGCGYVTRIALVPANGNNNVATTGQPRKVQLSLSLPPEYRTPVHKTTTIRSHPVWHDTYPLIRSSARQDSTTYDSKDVWLIPVWSMPINIIASPSKSSGGGGGKDSNRVKDPPGGQQAQRIVKAGRNGQLVSICEDVEQSIARHVWDCGLAMCDFIVRNKHHIKCNHIIELGSGTGLVGIVAALELQPRSTYLTDLPDALEIMQQNIYRVEESGSIDINIQAKVLSWGPKTDGDDVWMGDENEVDLVLLTDVLYNQGSHDLLLQTLDWLVVNPKCRVLLGYKERNEDERVFFTKLKERQWQCVLADTSDYEERPFEIYWIQKQT
ncbi:putative methyltransferase-domain-containing protein [Absidia repens]|uniref:Putative methyltransferase-domain-containing protein n=1 Tax=Absidia repens TaxID=90262 RepID=A0A1X2IQR3_9FUNG|nr:putative methyltransferase-domain-containing protein [Absidia repens]